MGFLRNRLLRRFSIIGRIADLAMVGGIAVRFAQRKGWISGSQSDQAGLAGAADGSARGVAEVALAAGAAWRLLRRKR